MLVRSRDAIVYSLIIRPRGRIPATEGCLVKRVAGPGLNTEFHYQVKHLVSFFYTIFSLHQQPLYHLQRTDFKRTSFGRF